jgi:hypothetical protein
MKKKTATNHAFYTGLMTRMSRTVLLAIVSAFLILPSVTLAYDYDSPLYSHRTKNYSDSHVDAYLDSNLPYGEGVLLFNYGHVSGKHSVGWWGLNPYNADDLRFDGQWYFEGVGASVSVGADSSGPSVGATFYADGDTAYFQADCSDCWKMEHYFDSISPSGVVYYRSESVTGSFRFGSTWVTITASDYDYL